MEEWMSKFMGEPFKRVDCNDCPWLNITEGAQQEPENRHKHHYCEFYHLRVIHRAHHRDHDFHLYPCEPCNSDENRAYYYGKDKNKGELDHGRL